MLKASERAETAVDPISFEVVRNALLFTTEEMSAALRRSAYSTNIKTRNDFSCALFDRDLRVIAQSFAQPVHLGSLAMLVPNAVRCYGAERLGPADVLVTNDPYLGNTHLNDIVLIAPVSHRGERCGYLANLAHHVDVGGGAPASIGAFREIYQEGVIIPPVKLVEDGAVVADAFRLILAQIRSKRETAGDIRAQIAGCITGQRRVAELLERLGADVVERYVEALLEYTRRRTRVELAKLPKGTFRAQGLIDNDGFTERRARIAVSITFDDDGIRFDLSGSDPQRRAPVNAPLSLTFAACAYALKCLVDPDLPVNQGFYDLVRVAAPPGTIVNCTAPAPVVGCGETHNRVTEVVLRALSQAVPERVPAGTKGMMCHAGFGGTDPRTGEYYCFLETLAGGYGGRVSKDGPDAVQTHGQNTENAPVEETEANYPVRILRYELVPDSDGPGRHRGGLGLRRDYHFPDHDATFTILADRDRDGPWGLFGGQPGLKASYSLNPEREAKPLGSKVTVELQAGDTVSYRTCGGGGYGNPSERDPALVVNDVREGKISLERARTVYGVEVDTATWIGRRAEE